MAFDGRINIIEIDDETRTVVFDLYRKKKISGTKLGPILGMSDLITPFKMACEIAGLSFIKADVKEWYWKADKQALAKDPCVVDAMIDLFIRTIDKYKAESEDKE